MEKSKKIMIVCIAALSVVCIALVGILIGMRMSNSAPASSEATPTEAAVQEQLLPETTEYIPVYTEAVPEPEQPEEIVTAAPTTTQPTTKATTTKAPTTKPATTKATATKPTTTKATTTQTTTTTTRPSTTQAPTTQAAETTTANRNGPYALIVHADNGAYDFTGGGRYSPGEFVKVTVTPKIGYTFVRWESSDKKILSDSTNQTYYFQMPASTVSLHAVTKQLPLLTVNKTKGISYTSSSSYYAPGTRVTVKAETEFGYNFTGWSSSSSTGTASAGLSSNSPSFTFTMPDKSITLTANAKEKPYALRITAGNGVRRVTGEGRYNAGERVTVIFSMYDNYTLNHWDGLNATYSGNTVTFNMPAKDLSLTASGTQIEKYNVTIVKGEGISSCTGAGTYEPGTTVTITCSMQKGYSFVSWESSDILLVNNSTKSTYTFVMPRGNITMSARTEKETEQFTVTLKKGTGIAYMQGGGTYKAGDTVTVYCTPEENYTFTSWTVASSTAVNEIKQQKYTFTMPKSDMTLTANASSNSPVFADPT